jgi:DNA-binding PadR family transcriptional regulator
MSGPTLNHIVLHKLGDHPLSGYALCTEIEKLTGKRPSYGSIYPILERLAAEHLVTVHVEGRKKVYTITAKGKEMAHSYKEQHQQFIENMIAQNRLLCELTNQDPEVVNFMLERLRQGDNPLRGVSDNAFKMRDALFNLARQGLVQKHSKKINQILIDTAKNLEKLK